MVSLCLCFEFTINCLETPSITINMTRVGVYNGKPIYLGNYGGETYSLQWNNVSSKWTFQNINDPTTIIFSNDQNSGNPCIINQLWDADNVVFCTTDADAITISELPIPCENFFTGDCSCQTLVNTQEECTVFFQTCDGNTVQQNINSIVEITGCFVGTPIFYPVDAGTVTPYTETTCDYFCIPGDKCCLSFTATSESETLIGTINPVGTINGNPFFIISAGTNNDLTLVYDSVSEAWLAVRNNNNNGLVILFSLKSENNICPIGSWQEEFDLITLTTEQVECPLPSPTPTPTITPTITPTPTPTQTQFPIPTPKFFDFVNECNVITLFPMGVDCLVVNPSPEGSDGVASLIITGGTPPYDIIWDDGNVSPVIYNLTAGSYGATVVDYYGDFTAKTVCVLTGSTPTPSQTPTPSPSTPYVQYTMCMTVRISKEGAPSITNTTYTPNGIFNGRPSWVSFDSLSNIIWDTSVTPNRWVVSSSTPTLFTILNQNPSYPPITGGWNIVGKQGVVNVVSGACEGQIVGLSKKPLTLDPVNPLSIRVSKNDTICSCDGSLSIIANGGYPPYIYSIDSGLNYKTFPIFNNLCSGIYSVKVIDSLGNEIVNSIKMPEPKNPVTYNLTVNTTKKIESIGSLYVSTIYNTTFNVTPELPDGVTISFDFNHSNNSKSSPSITSSTVNTSTSLKINGFEYSPTSTTNTTGETLSTLAGCQLDTVYINSINESWDSILTLTNQTSYEITTITKVYKNEDNNCYIGTSEDIFQVSNVSISGCYCCNVTI